MIRQAAAAAAAGIQEWEIETSNGRWITPAPVREREAELKLTSGLLFAGPQRRQPENVSSLELAQSFMKLQTSPPVADACQTQADELADKCAENETRQPG